MRHAILILLGLPAIAVAQIKTLDPDKVTNITQAAEACGLTEAGVTWVEASADTLQITVATAEALATLAEIAALRTCFFPWAYERKVTVAFGLAKAVPR